MPKISHIYFVLLYYQLIRYLQFVCTLAKSVTTLVGWLPAAIYCLTCQMVCLPRARALLHLPTAIQPQTQQVLVIVEWVLVRMTS